MDEKLPSPIEPLTTTPSLQETYERLGLSPRNRLLTGAGVAYAGGILFGLSIGGRTAGLRFRAENAHRLPTNKRGWYLYHQEKNKQVIWESFKEGNRMGWRLSPLVVLFIGTEEVIDTLRSKGDGDDSRKDFLSTTVAGMTVAGTYSWWHRLPMTTKAKMLKTGLLFGLGLGLAQDGLRILKGQRLAYTDLIERILDRRQADSRAKT